VAQTHAEIQNQDARASKSLPKASGLLNVAAAGSLIAGTVGIIRALEMERAGDGLLCIFALVAAMSLVCYLYCQRDGGK
jgi:hypothetical protein